MINYRFTINNLMLNKFRRRFPQGSLVSELLAIDHGKYLVRVLVEVEGVILASGLAAADTVELAEDSARSRALELLDWDDSSDAVNVVNVINATPASKSTVEKETGNALGVLREGKTTIAPKTERVDALGKPHEGKTTIAPKIEEIISTSPEKYEQPSEQALELPLSAPQTTPEITQELFSLETDHVGKDNGFVKGGEPSHPTGEITPLEANPSGLDASNPDVLDFSDIIAKTDIELKRLNWTQEQGRDYLLATYGKKSRLHLSDAELLEFLNYLEGQQ
jgi:hypothetical protein